MNVQLISEPFLQGILREKEVDIAALLRSWELSDFESTLDKWFANFSASEKRLALKVLLNIDYYSASRYNKVLRHRGDRISQILHAERRCSLSDAFILTAAKRGDSSDAHAYALTKEWGIPQERVVPLSDISVTHFGSSPLILFNDTHGSGKQFLTDWLPFVKPLVKDRAVFLVALTISETAMRRFRQEFPDAFLIPDEPAMDARRSPFTPSDLEALHTIGKRIYPAHPLGYGGTALLTAYYYQCPNNSLPIIWANGANNGGFPWSPLFPYKPKHSASKTSYTAKPKTRKVASHHESGRDALVEPTPEKQPAMAPRGVLRQEGGLPDIFTPGVDVASLRAVLNPIIGEARTEQVIAISEAGIEITASGDFMEQASLGQQLVEVAGEVPEFHASGLYYAAEGYRLLGDVVTDEVERQQYRRLAEEHYLDALRIAPDAPSPIRGLGRLKEVQGAYDEAIRLFEAAHGFAIAGFAAGRTLQKAPALAHEILRSSRHHIHCILGIAASDAQSKWRREIHRTEIAGEIARSDRYHQELMVHFRSNPRWLYIECFMAMVFLAKAWGAIGNASKAEYYYLEGLYARRKLIGSGERLTPVELNNLVWWTENTLSTAGLSKDFVARVEKLQSMLASEATAQSMLGVVDDLIQPASAVRHILQK